MLNRIRVITLSLLIVTTCASPSPGQLPLGPTLESDSTWCGSGRLLAELMAGRKSSAPGCDWTNSLCDTPTIRDSYIAEPYKPMTWIRVYVHFVAKDDCSSPVTPWSVEDWERDVNAILAPYRIGLRFTTNVICDSHYWSIDSDEPWEIGDSMALEYSIEPDKYLNVFFLVAPYNWAWMPWGWSPLDPRHCIVMTHQQPIVFVHELGHALGLYHSFQGVYGACGPCQEIPGAADRDRNGDYCSDTDPTPLSYDCEYPQGVDPCAHLPWGNVPTGNIMSYQKCKSWFSPQQTGRMFCWINNGMPSWVEHLAIDTLGAAFGVAPVTASFTGWCPEDDCQWLWDFGDGGTGIDANPTHTYTQPGIYSVQATVTKSTGTHSTTFENAAFVAADTITLGQGWFEGNKGYVDVALRNYVPVTALLLPFRWDGPISMKFDSTSVSGMRGETFYSHGPISIIPGVPQAAVAFRATSDNPLPPGDGPIARLHFTLLSQPGSQRTGNPITVFEYSRFNLELSCVLGSYPPHRWADGFLAYDCCKGTVGDANGDGVAEPSIGDVSIIIDHLFISGIALDCYAEADINKSGGATPTADDISIGDVSALIDHLFISGGYLSDCH